MTIDFGAVATANRRYVEINLASEAVTVEVMLTYNETLEFIQLLKEAAETIRPEFR